MFQKLLAFTKKVSDFADHVTGNATANKAQFDAAPEELRTYFNNLIDDLKSTSSDDSGAKNIGAKSITDLSGSDVQSLLESLKTLVDKKIKGNGELLQSGKTNTLTVPSGQTFAYDFAYPTPYATGIEPRVIATPYGAVVNCADMKHSITSITNTGFRIEIKNTGSVDEYAFYNWIAIG